jgi:hypothetical protein
MCYSCSDLIFGGDMPGLGGPCGSCIFNLLFSIIVALVYIPICSVQVFCVLTSLPVLAVFSLFDHSHCYWGEVI